MLPKGLKLESVDVEVGARQILIHCEGGELECFPGMQPHRVSGSVSGGAYIMLDNDSHGYDLAYHRLKAMDNAEEIY